MDQTRRFRIPLKPVVLVVVLAAVAANLPAGWFADHTPEARRAQVFSDFVALSAEPGEGAFAFLGTVAEVSGQDRRMRRARLAQAHPGALSAYADRIGVDETWLRGAMLDPAFAHPFDMSAYELGEPRFARHGSGGAWDWGLAGWDAKNIAPEDSPLRWCARWLVFWNDTDWFYAPVGTAVLNEIVAEQVPDLEMPKVEGCTADG